MQNLQTFYRELYQRIPTLREGSQEDRRERTSKEERKKRRQGKENILASKFLHYSTEIFWG
jgi:hypothetical protein